MKTFMTKLAWLVLVTILAAWVVPVKGGSQIVPIIEKKSCLAPDGVNIVYSVAGAGEPGLLFIHGGLADRSFWDAELKAFSDKHRVIALDLPGHGESGRNRSKWGIPEFGADVRAVVRAEKLKKVILLGNSLGGPTAVEAALLLPGIAVAVIGVDTFQYLDYITSPEEARKKAEAFRADLPGSVKAMVESLFHPDADPAVMAEAERRMERASPEAAYALFLSIGGYDTIAAVRKLAIPLRSINGDLYPLDVAQVRKVKPDFAAVIMKHMGHYPMLERPAEFNRLLADMIAGF
jgi:pimeloyl-ACP methyl ester carboxylesterase